MKILLIITLLMLSYYGGRTHEKVLFNTGGYYVIEKDQGQKAPYNFVELKEKGE